MKNNIHISPMTILLGGALFLAIISFIYTSMQVGVLTKKVEQTKQQILSNEQVSNTLDAEWAYLTDPDRIERLSKALLPKEQGITAKDIYHIDNIKSADSIQTVSVGNVSYNIYNTNN